MTRNDDDRGLPLDEAEQAVRLLEEHSPMLRALALIAKAVGSMRENQRRLDHRRERLDAAMIDRLDQILGEIRLGRAQEKLDARRAARSGKGSRE